MGSPLVMRVVAVVGRSCRIASFMTARRFDVASPVVVMVAVGALALTAIKAGIWICACSDGGRVMVECAILRPRREVVSDCGVGIGRLDIRRFSVSLNAANPVGVERVVIVSGVAGGWSNDW